MDDKRDLRESVTDADATGMIAGEELITQAETLLPTLQLQTPVPRDEMHAALPDAHEAHDTIDRLHTEMAKSRPDVNAVRDHVHRLRLIPEVEARIVTWWDDPRTQEFFADLARIGV